MSKKSTNFELLRILLTLFIPTYHWLLYNGIFYADNSINNLIAIVPFTGISFSCLYAFITMSSYFLLKKKGSFNLRKVLDFIALCITLWIFKTILINCLFSGWRMNYFIDSFFLKGAWWYVYPYILLMIFYPALNHFVYNSKKSVLYLCTALFGVWFLINEIINQTMFINDCVMFLFMYLLIGCLIRLEPGAFIRKYKKQILVTSYILCVGTIIVVSLFLKMPNNDIELETENEIFQWAHGRYNILGVISGISLFALFKNINIPYTPVIHKISKLTLLVFLLHETVMSVFWYFEIKSCEYLAYLPAWQFWGYFFLYVLLCFGFAYVAQKTYDIFFAPLWNNLFDKILEK